MPRHDATVEVVCDECGCTDIWSPEYVFDDYSGRSGNYDTSDAAFSMWCGGEGWTQDGEKTFCDDCSYEAD